MCVWLVGWKIPERMSKDGYTMLALHSIFNSPAENAVQWRRSYQRTVADIVSVHLLPHFGQQEVGSISREQILIFRSSLAKAPGRKKETLSPRRINAVMNILRGILFEASDRYQFTCPFYNIKPLKVAKSDVQPFTLDEVKALLNAVREDYRDYYTVRFFTGLRTGEIDGLKWKYVDFSRRLILIRETLVAGEEDDRFVADPAEGERAGGLAVGRAHDFAALDLHVRQLGESAAADDREHGEETSVG